MKQKNKSKWIDKLRFRIKSRSKLENSNTIDNNTIDNITIDNTIDNKISDKIRDIWVILSRLGNIVTKNNKKKIKKELFKIENKNNLSDNEKKEIYGHLDKLIETLNKKDKYKHNDHDDLDYYGIRDMENLFDNCNENDYYKPILVKSPFNENYKYYESRGDKDKNYR